MCQSTPVSTAAWSTNTGVDVAIPLSVIVIIRLNQLPPTGATFSIGRARNGAQVCTPVRARFGGTYTKIGTIQRRLAWPLRKDDTQIREAFQIFFQQS